MTTTPTAQLPGCPKPSAYVSIGYSLCDFFGDRMFNLESRVDFDEVVLAVFVHQELHSAGVLVAHLQKNNTAGKQFFISNNISCVNSQGGALTHLNEP